MRFVSPTEYRKPREEAPPPEPAPTEIQQAELGTLGRRKDTTYGQPLYLDLESGVPTAAGTLGSGQTNPPLYWRPTDNMLTLTDTGTPARYGVQASLEPRLAESIAQFQTQQQEQAALEQQRRQQVEQELQMSLPPATSRMTEGLTTTLAGAGYDPTQVSTMAASQRYQGVIEELQGLDMTSVEDQRQYSKLLREELRLRPYDWQEPGVVGALSRTGEPTTIPLPTDKWAEPWTERALKPVVDIARWLLQTTTRYRPGYRPAEGEPLIAELPTDQADAILNQWMGGNFWEQMQRPFVYAIETGREKYPIVDLLFEVPPLVSDIVKMGFGMGGRTIDVSAMLADPESDDAELAVATGLPPALAFSPGFDIDSWNKNLDDIRAARDRVFDRDQTSLIDLVGGFDNLSEERQREIRGEVLSNQIDTQEDMNATLEREQEEARVLFTEMATGLQMFRGSLNEATINMMGDVALEAASDYWYALKGRTDIPSGGYRHTWGWSTDGERLEELADQAIIAAMVQKGRPLQNWEIESITNRYVEVGPELFGGVVFDMLNFPGLGAVVGKLFRGALGVPKKVAYLVPGGKGKVLWESASSFFKAGAIASVSRRFGNSYNSAMIKVLQAVGGDYDEFVDGVKFCVNAAQDIPNMGKEAMRRYGVSERLLRGLYKAFEALPPDKFDDAIHTAASLLGEGVTPQGVADIFGEIVARSYRDSNVIKGLQQLDALDEGMLKYFFPGKEGDGILKYLRPTDGRRYTGTVAQQAATLWMRGQRFFRKVWTPMVLTWRPGYTVINHLDNTFRGIVSGVDMFTGLDTVLQRSGSLITDELLGGYGRAAEMAGDITIGRMIVNGDLRPNFFELFAYGWNHAKGGNPLARWGSAWGAVSNGSEAVSRIKLFDNVLQNNRRILGPAIDALVGTVFGKYSDDIQDVARSALRQAADDPVYFSRLLKGEAGVRSVLVPEDLYRLWTEWFGEDVAKQFVRRTVADLQVLIDKGELTPANVQVMFSDINEAALRHRDNALDLAASTRGPTGPAQPGRAMEGISEALDGEQIVAQAEDITEAQRLANETAVATENTAREAAMEGLQPTTTAGPVTDTRPSLLERIQQRAKELRLRVPVSFDAEAVQGIEITAQDWLRIDLSELDEARTLFDDVAEFDGLVRADYDLHRITGSQLARSTRELSELIQTRTVAGAFDASPEAGHYVNQYLREFDRLARGPVRTFAAEVNPGPVRMRDMGYSGGGAWLDYFAIEERSHLVFDAMNREVIDLLNQGDVGLAELVTRWNNGMPTFAPRSDVLRSIGYQVRGDETGLIRWFRYKTDMPWNALDAPAFRKFFGVNTIDEWNTLPYNVTAEQWTAAETAIREAEVGVAARSMDELVAATRQEMVADEIWNEIMNHTPFLRGRTITRGNVYAARLGDDVIRTPEAFVEAMTDAITRADEAGNLVEARVLERRLQEIVGELNASRVAEGLTELQELHVIPRYQLTDGMQTFMQIADEADAHYALLTRATNEWQDYLVRAIDNDEWYVKGVDDAARASLTQLADEVTDIMGEAQDVIQNGGTFAGRTVVSAVDEANRVYIDYTKFGSFDRFMKENLAPFWMFPSRTIPMWIDTMAHKPWLMSMYYKYMMTSERLAYERGAITRSGHQLPSLRGYLPIPGTDKWINPMGPFSLRYALPEFRKWGMQEDELSPSQQLGNFIMDMTRPFGLFPAPWVNWIMYDAFHMLDENVHPKFALVPQISLLPPQFQHFVVRQLRKFDAVSFPEGHDMLTPWVSWKDFLIGYRVLANAMERCQNATLSTEQKLVITENARAAQDFERREQDPELQALWDAAKTNIENSDYARSLLGYVTSIYTKEFSTAQAEFVAMRQGYAILQQSLNNEAMAAVFDIPADVVARWEQYKDERYNTPEGVLASTYNDISYVTDDAGAPQYGVDRLKIISQVLHEGEVTQAWHDKRREIFDRYDLAHKRLPVGTPWETRSALYEQMQTELAQLDANPMYRDRKIANVIGYMPEKLVYEELANHIWRAFRDLIPRWDPGEETYPEWDKKRKEFVANLPNMAQVLITPYYTAFANASLLDDSLMPPEMIKARMGPLRALIFPEINMPENLRERLMEEFSDPARYELWQKSKDSEWEALENAWEEIFWRPRWDALIDPASGEFYGGDAFRLAESAFLQQFGPEGRPSNEQLVKWVQENYPARWESQDLLRILQGTTTYSAEDRLAEQRGEAYSVEQDLWDLLWRVNPGQQYGDFLDMIDVVGKERGIGADDLSTWYNTGGNSDAWSDPAEFQALMEVVQEAISAMNIPEPTQADMRERVEAKKLNETFQALRDKELGDDIETLMTYYYNLSPNDRRTFRQSAPSEYERIQKYYNLRDQYAQDNLIWAKYYHREAYEAIQAGKPIGEGYGVGVGRAAAARAPARAAIPTVTPRMGLRGAEDVRELMRRGLGRGGLTAKPVWPRWLLEMLGAGAVSEVEKAAEGKLPVPKLTKDYIKNIDDNHPEQEVEEEVKKTYSKLGGGRYR